MKRKYTALFGVIMALGFMISGCKPKVKSVTERLAKTWTAEKVVEGSTVKYVRGATGNAEPRYSNFKLTLVEGGNATLVEFDNNSFSGKWELTGDTKLTLKDLTPQPTGTGGIIEFTITSIEDSKLALSRVGTSIKTGGSVNVYSLTNP
jgi:hypothetical protein